MGTYKLNKSQLEAVEYNDGPLLIIAGAGTGKTTVITKKISHLIEQKLATPEQILALTFTDKAAGEMQTRVDEMIDIGYVDLQISTFHAFCQRLLEEFGMEIGLPRHFKLLTQTDAWLLVREHLYDFSLDYYRPLGNPTGNIHELLKHFSKCKDELVSTEEYLRYVESLKLDTDSLITDHRSPINNQGLGTRDQIDIKKYYEVANAYHTYNQLLLDNNALDFGDLIYYTVKLLKDRPNILKRLQERFKYILVDEFQDVNWSQYELIRLLTNAKSTQLTVVGDDDQSIYAFRGSNVSIIMRFKEDYPDAKEIVLTENYRSGQEILDLAYKSIQNNNPDRLEVKLNVNKQLNSKKKSDQGSGIRDQKSKNTDHRSLNTYSPSAVEHIHCDTLDEEVYAVIAKISEICEDKSVVLDDIAILVRANSHVEPFINALEKAGIPYEYIAFSGLYRQSIILDAINFLKLLNNYHEDTAVYRLLCLSFSECKENDLQKFTMMAKKKSVSYYEALKRTGEFGLSQEGSVICSKILEWIHTGMKSARFEKPTTVLYEFFETSGYLSYLAHEENVGNREIIRQIHYLKQFFDSISAYEHVIPDAHVSDFVGHLMNIVDSGDEGKIYQPTDTPDSVNIMTVHGAKGLEFKYVFIVNCVEERFPTRKKGEGIAIPDALVKDELRADDFHYQEERRLFYVAVTRAKEKLFLTSAEDYGGVRKKKLSRFLDELGFIFNDQGSGVRDQKTYVSSLTMKQLNNEAIFSKKNQTDTQSQTPLQNTFSYSQLNSYDRCPYQYKLAYILKLPMKGSANFSFGNSIHNTLQKFYQRIQELNSVQQASLFGLPVEDEKPTSGEIRIPSLDELLTLYEESWIDDWYKSKRQREDYYTKGKDLLKIFYESQNGTWTVPVALEGWFKVKIGEYIINGRMDRIDQLSDNSLEIIDYKTGKAKDDLTTDDKQQLLIYQMAAMRLPEYHHIGPVSQLSFYYVNENKKIPFIGSEKDIVKAEEKIVGMIEKIHSGNFTATPGKHVCQHCDFRDICEFRQL
ncbi:MAG: ATP-dependent DNA helicase [Candidatus Magasanikbacteria bacterium]